MGSRSGTPQILPPVHEGLAPNPMEGQQTGPVESAQERYDREEAEREAAEELRKRESESREKKEFFRVIAEAMSTSISPLINSQKSRTTLVAAPEAFGGTATEDVLDWLFRLDLYVQFNATDFKNDADRVMYSISRMKGVAGRWAMLKAQEGSYHNETGIFGDYQSFGRQVKDVFIGTDRALVAERKLRGLRQTGRVSEYATAFNEQSRYLNGWGDAPLIAAYRQGLKEEIRMHMFLVKAKDRPTTLAPFVQWTLELDEHVQEIEESKRRDAGFKKGHWGGGGQTSSSSGSQGSSHSAPKNEYVPMDVDVSKKGGRKDKSKVKCFACGRMGHYASDHKGGEIAAKFGKIVEETVEKKTTVVLEGGSESGKA